MSQCNMHITVYILSSLLGLLKMIDFLSSAKNPSTLSFQGCGEASRKNCSRSSGKQYVSWAPKLPFEQIMILLELQPEEVM